jgi:hypothetical protein
MRAAFGLVSILVAIGVVVMIMHYFYLPSVQQAVGVRKKVTPQVQQMGGRGTDGVDARKSISLDAEQSAGRMNSVIVTAIDPIGPMAKYFGLQVGDSIVEISPQGGFMMPVRDMASSDEAKDQLLTAYQNSQQIVIVRDGKKTTLPVKPVPGAHPAPGAPPTANPTATPLQSQLDSIKNGVKIPTH